MKKLILILSVFTALPFISRSQTRLEVTVENVRLAQGTIRVGLFDSETNFLKKAIKGEVVKASATKTVVIFENLKPGQYGLSVFHDENENGELDSNMVGIPKEGFAFGNNSMGMFGPPSFEKAKIKITSGETSRQTLKLKYF